MFTCGERRDVARGQMEPGVSQISKGALEKRLVWLRDGGGVIWRQALTVRGPSVSMWGRRDSSPVGSLLRLLLLTPALVINMKANKAGKHKWGDTAGF